MNDVTAITPEARPASRLVRGLALSIDVLLPLGLLLLGVAGALVAAGATLHELVESESSDALVDQVTASIGGAAGLAALLAAGVLFMMLVVYQMYSIAVRGQTIGKRLCGIRIVRADGAPAGFYRGVVLRWLVFSVVLGLVGLVPVVGPILPLVDYVPVFGERRRCVHDYFAGTRVDWASARAAQTWRLGTAGLIVLTVATTCALLLAPDMLRDPRGWWTAHAAGSVTTSTTAAPVMTTPPPTTAPAPPEPFYRYVDAKGTLHYVQGLNAVPPDYRAGATLVR